MTPSLLDAHDFACLLHAGASFHLARIHGIPPEIMTATNIGDLSWADFPFENSLASFETETRLFFGLSNRPSFARGESLSATGERLRDEWLRDSGSVVFHTSGSTGVPIPHRHTSAMLRQEAEGAAGLFSGVKRVVCTTPPFHSYGFIFGFLLPKIARIRAAFFPALPTLVGDRLREGDVLVGFPQLLGAMITPPPPAVHCLTSTAPCPPGLFGELAARGFAGTTEIYGSSETGAIGARTKEENPFTLLPHWRKRDAASIFRQACGDGDDQAFMLSDEVEWRDDNHLLPVGRIDRAVQVAGVNVYPQRIAALLQQHPLVRECAVRPMAPDEGFRLKAFIVPEKDADLRTLRQWLRAYIRTTFTTAERPVRLTFGPELPRTGMGKLCDWD